MLMFCQQLPFKYFNKIILDTFFPLNWNHECKCPDYFCDYLMNCSEIMLRDSHLNFSKQQMNMKLLLCLTRQQIPSEFTLNKEII